MKKEIVKTVKESDMKIIGEDLARQATPGMVLALIGDLGAGKTTLTQHIARGLGITQPITSPTFTLINEYREGRIPLYHFDVYRLERSEELENLGYEDYFYGDGLCVVEWADKVLDYLPPEAKILKITYGDTPEERRYQWLS